MGIDRKQILISFLDVINDVSNKEYQKRVWIEGNGPECDDFDETTCYFFDMGDPILDDYKNFGITDEQYNILVKFRDEFEKFSRTHDLPQEFINSPEWEKIMKMAKEVLDAFNYNK